jgi:glucokinase
VSVVPVLEVGGTHVSAAVVDAASWAVVARTRLSVDGDAPADALLSRFVEAAATVSGVDGAVWGVAMPDPFDYMTGVALFAGVGKFGALHGVDVRSALMAGIAARPSGLAFVNDADAFTLGEWRCGAAAGASRVAGITLGTGVGSGWLVDGVVVDPGLPPGGRIHQVSVSGVPLEDVMSRRAIRRAYVAAGGSADSDVREIAALARGGDPVASAVLDRALAMLGAVVGECVAGFRADVLVIGGSMAASWDVFEPAFRRGAAAFALPETRLASDSDAAPLVGAAVHAARAARA